MRIGLLSLVMMMGCAEPEYKACKSLCTELVRGCQLQAFPTTDSCMLGCADEAANGADVLAQEPCVLEAECDTFAILECQNEFGAGS
jgi:hypothetical protein